MAIHKAEPLVPEPSLVEAEIAIGNLKSYKFPGNDQITAEMIEASGETLSSEIYRLINSIFNKVEFPHLCEESVIGPINKNGGNTDCNNH
jgi:hypothetical protein